MSAPLDRLLVLGATGPTAVPVLDGSTFDLSFAPFAHVADLGRLDHPILVRVDAGGDAAIECLSRLSPSEFDHPILAVSMTDNESEALRALAAGADEYLAPGRIPGGSVAAAIARGRARRKAAARARNDLRSVAGEITVVNSRLSTANEELRSFSQTVAHDLSSPLTQISIYAELLEREITRQTMDKAIHYGKRIREAAERAVHLLNSLYLAAKSGAGAEPATDVDLNAIVSEVLADFDHRLQSAGARVSVGTLPTVQARARQMYQLFGNLIDNAIKHAGEAAPAIEINAVPLEREWVVSVKDNGVGIAEDHWQSIFEPYRRLGTGGRKGFGIGLSICRRIVENHGGRIWVNSAPGRGATFFFTLPLAS